ncbi:hypothetical protein QUB75_09000 [Microcoleus sp. K1-B6]|uniref:hypothetical protein n=1 Tax=unclassified Microcoleus TaxID=2642155 RepID=UPI002FD44CD0
MPLSADCPNGRSQLLMFPRRELLQKIASAALLFFVPRIQPVTLSKSYPSPAFNIGDLIASDWVDDDDEDAPDSATDFSEILGMRWLPESESGLAANTWVYFVRWTHTTSGLDYLYPCYDGEPTMASGLRLVSHD